MAQQRKRQSKARNTVEQPLNADIVGSAKAAYDEAATAIDKASKGTVSLIWHGVLAFVDAVYSAGDDGLPATGIVGDWFEALGLPAAPLIGQNGKPIGRKLDFSLADELHAAMKRHRVYLFCRMGYNEASGRVEYRYVNRYHERTPRYWKQQAAAASSKRGKKNASNARKRGEQLAKLYG